MKDIEFNGEFEEEQDLCSICGAETNLTGWNEEKDLDRFECSECGAVFIYDRNYNETILKGEKRNWGKFMSENLKFPFTAIVTEYQNENIFKKERGSIKQDGKVIVESVLGEDDFYGVIVKIRIKNKTFQFPLCDLGVEDKTSPNFKIVDNYATWFANCR